MLSLNWFRGVIWPRKDKTTPEGKQLYRYVVLGMLVTDEPIKNLSGNEFVLDGSSAGMRLALELIPQKKANPRIGPLGDANSVLTRLDILVED